MKTMKADPKRETTRTRNETSLKQSEMITCKTSNDIFRCSKNILLLGRSNTGKTTVISKYLSFLPFYSRLHIFTKNAQAFSLFPQAIFYSELDNAIDRAKIIMQNTTFNIIIIDDCIYTSKAMKTLRDIVNVYCPKSHSIFIVSFHNLTYIDFFLSIIFAMDLIFIPLHYSNNRLADILQKKLKYQSRFWPLPPNFNGRGFWQFQTSNQMEEAFATLNSNSSDIDLSLCPAHLKPLGDYLQTRLPDSIFDKRSLTVTYKSHSMHYFDFLQLIKMAHSNISPPDSGSLGKQKLRWLRQLERRLSKLKVFVPKCL